MMKGNKLQYVNQAGGALFALYSTIWLIHNFFFLILELENI